MVLREDIGRVLRVVLIKHDFESEDLVRKRIGRGGENTITTRTPRR